MFLSILHSQQRRKSKIMHPPDWSFEIPVLDMKNGARTGARPASQSANQKWPYIKSTQCLIHLLSLLVIDPAMLPTLPVGLRSLVMDEDRLLLPLGKPPGISIPFKPVLPDLMKPVLFARSFEGGCPGSCAVRPFGSVSVFARLFR